MDDRRDPRPTEAQVNEDGVDLTLIRWSLSLSPLERLRVLEGHMEFAAKVQQVRRVEQDIGTPWSGMRSSITKMTAREQYDSLREGLRALDPLLIEALADVDRTLIRSYLAMDPWERLRLGARAAEELAELAACRRLASNR